MNTDIYDITTDTDKELYKILEYRKRTDRELEAKYILHWQI